MPLVVRMQGTNEDLGKKILKDSGLPIISADNMAEAGAEGRRRGEGEIAMSILIDKNTRVVTQGITGKTGQFHTKMGNDYANGKNCYVAGVNPKKAGESFRGHSDLRHRSRRQKKQTGANVSVIYVPPPFAAAAIWEAVEADLDLVICITEGIPVRDMIRTKYKMQGRKTRAGRARTAPA